VTASRDDLVAIFRAAVEATDPQRLLGEHLRHDEHETVVTDAAGVAAARFCGLPFVAAVGKAAAGMAEAVCRFYANAGAGTPNGLVIVPKGNGQTCPLPVRQAGHPLPDSDGEAAAAEMARRIATADEPTVLFLLSGGASSLLVRPRPPVSLADKIEVTRLLLGAGAGIEEFNAVRKHLSLVKGGGLLRAAAPRQVVTLILSDVVGDDPAVIGSGPTAADPTTYADSLEILRRYAIAERVPDSVRRLLAAGAAGEVPETLKPDELGRYDTTHLVIGSNRLALEGAARCARRLGYEVRIAPQPLTGDTTTAARLWAARLVEPSGNVATCELAGGETTVEVRGGGRGGRNQEFALAMAGLLEGKDIAVLSAGTDGIDGPTDAAGAFVDGTTLERARTAGLDPEAALGANDSYGFFEPLGDLFRCGPTGTNVMDIKIALRAGRAVARPGASG